MSAAEVFAAILSATIAVLVAGASLLWFTYRRGIAAGVELAKRQDDERVQAESKAKIDALERLLMETRAELATLQPRRKRSFAKREQTLTGT